MDASKNARSQMKFRSVEEIDAEMSRLNKLQVRLPPTHPPTQELFHSSPTYPSIQSIQYIVLPTHLSTVHHQHVPE